MRRSMVLATLALTTLSVAACAGTAGPLTKGREVLGTAVTVAVYSDAPGTSGAIDDAFAAMSAVDGALDPYDATSTIGVFNAAPYEPHPLPEDALLILDRAWELDVAPFFSSAMFGVTNLYDFGGAGTVPATETLQSAVAAAETLHVREDGTASFIGRQTLGNPGLDLGGASKGLAIDRAASRLAGLPALITAGSSTLAFGAKPDGEPWRVGIEDPREVGRVLAIVSSEGTLSVSTSGDYQVSFERDGVRYHHILDPASGLPARGIRSLTVFGKMSGLDADILSTALFVMGREKAIDYALEHGIGLYLVDDVGLPHTSEPDATVRLKIEAEPRH